jgi:hypothetical protein
MLPQFHGCPQLHLPKVEDAQPIIPNYTYVTWVAPLALATVQEGHQ